MSRRNKTNGQDETPERERIAITDISQLAPQDIEIVVTQGDYDLAIPLRVLTFAEWAQVDRDIPPPNPPAVAGPKGMMYDRESPDYLRALEEAAQRRMLLRVARSLRLEGLTGKTPDEEIDRLQNTISMDIVNGLVLIVRQLHMERNARIEARANSFQRDRQRDSSNM